jgi:mono/diheme cytochrome c family protein
MRYVSRFMLFCVLLLGAVPAAAQRTPSIAIDSLTGRDSYEFYCAACHGRDGRGDGPVGQALRVTPADLTTLAQRHGGTFPREDVRKYVIGMGRAIPAHGPTEMPVWGPIFRTSESDARVRVRIDNLLDYLDKLQVRTARVTVDSPSPATK